MNTTEAQTKRKVGRPKKVVDKTKPAMPKKPIGRPRVIKDTPEALTARDKLKTKLKNCRITNVDMRNCCSVEESKKIAYINMFVEELLADWEVNS